MTPTDIKPTDTEETVPKRTLLTPEQRAMTLELALDTLTIQIASQESLIAPGQRRVRLLQDQVRLIASQIRSYERLEALKKSLGFAGATLQEKDESPSDNSALQETADMSRAARRRLKRLEAKQAKKNKSALLKGAAANAGAPSGRKSAA